MKKNNNTFIGAGLLSALTASLCCITPALALISGASGVASTFSWMEPARPYLIGLTVLVLGFAWYQTLKPRTAEEIRCDCGDEKKPFMQTKTFLGMVTVFAVLMLAFPYYAHIFYPETDKQAVVVDQSNIHILEFSISGMTCQGCEEKLNHEINKLPGIIKSTASYPKGNAIVEFDSSKTEALSIEKAIGEIGYEVRSRKKK